MRIRQRLGLPGDTAVRPHTSLWMSLDPWEAAPDFHAPSLFRTFPASLQAATSMPQFPNAESTRKPSQAQAPRSCMIKGPSTPGVIQGLRLSFIKEGIDIFPTSCICSTVGVPRQLRLHSQSRITLASPGSPSFPPQVPGLLHCRQVDNQRYTQAS